MQNQPATDLRGGMDVLGSDGDKLGEVERIRSSYFVVKEGFFFPKEQFIPLSAIAGIDDDGVHLSVTKEKALYQGWETEPKGEPEDLAPEGPTRRRAGQFELGTQGEYRRGRAGNAEEEEKRTFSPADAEPSPGANEERFTRGAAAAPLAGEPVVDRDGGSQPPETKPFDTDADDPAATVARSDLNTNLGESASGEKVRDRNGHRRSGD